MSTTNNISYSLDLSNVIENDVTRELFLVASRTGEAKVLDTVDAVSYYLYVDRFERCGGEAFCENKISFADMKLRPYNREAGAVAQSLAQLSQTKQAEIWRRALVFMASANEIVSRSSLK